MGLTHAQAQPVGASVIAGQAQVLSSGATTMVNQNSAKAIINWQDFSVGAGASVQFNQPNASSITLNRVTGSNLSTIDGAIRANGQVWLLNPNGVLFGNNARINVGGLLATTSDLANQDFLGGRYNFSGGNGEIVNNGQIRVRDGGSVVLSAPRVTNRGLIAARAGRVVLGGTDTFTVDFNGDRLLSYAVGASSQTGSVTNSGTVQAQGGRVLMTARAASGVQDAVINNSGMAEATSARSVNGEIILDAGEGTATNAGTLDASGKTAFETGGTVKVLGRLAAVPDNAVIDVSGNAGGGTVMIGGNFQGRGLEQHAQATTIGKATINADAIVRGNGGQVAVWSDGRTDVSGSITARGGAGGGNGGQVETSGHDLNITGSAYVSARAFQGKAGILLLDPHNINITNSGTDYPNQAFGSAPMVDANVNPATIAAVLQAGTDVTMQAATDIIFLNDLTSTTGIAGATLTLQAGRTISLGTNSINIPLSNLVMIANDPGGVPTGFRDAGTAFIGTISGAITAARLDLIMSAGGTPGTIGSSSTPLIVLGATPTYISTPNTDAWISTGTSGVFHFAIGNTAHTNGVEIGTGNLNLVVNGSQQTAPILANNVTVTLPSGVTSGNPVNWDNAGNAFNGTVSITATNLSFTAQGNNAIALNASPNVIGAASLSAGTNILLYNTGNLTLNKVQGTSVNIQTTGTLTLATPATGATITASDFTVLHAGASILGNSGAVIASPTVSLIADTGTIGALGQPVGIATNNFAARTANRDIIVTATQFNNNPNTITTISGLSTAASGMIASTAVSGVNAGSGNAFLNGGAAVNWRNFSSAQVTNSIFANQLRISGASVTLTGVNISALTSFVSGGDLSISAARGFEIFDGAGAFGLLVTNGSIFLNANGSIGQAQGQAGTISASGTFNASATFLSGGGIFLNNTLNKVGGAVTLNAPGNILFYNAVNIASLLAGSPSGGEIDITSGGNINIGNSLDGGPAIRTSGNVELTAESGFIIQSSGASGAIKAGTLSSFGGNGNTLDNAANAISGRIEFGSLGNATLVNSITTNLGIALAGGTLTVQSGGDLVLLAGPTIAARLRSNDITIDNPNVRAQVTLAQLAGNIVSTKVGGDGIILAASGNFINNAGATALFLPGGARFLIYSTDPAANVFGNVRTPNAGIFGTTYPAAITAAGNRYIFTVASSTNNSFQGGDGLSLGGGTAASPDLIGFVTAGRPPPRQPPPPPPLARADILQILGNRPPPPPPPPPRNSPLAELAGPEANAEPPSSSDQATSFVASSLEGGLPPVTGSAGGGTIIPRYLTAQPILPSGTLEDPSLLPAFGNLSLWQ